MLTHTPRGKLSHALRIHTHPDSHAKRRHKSLGLLAGILVAPRFIVRLGSKIPAAMEGTNSLQQLASKATHYGMYVLRLRCTCRVLPEDLGNPGSAGVLTRAVVAVLGHSFVDCRYAFMAVMPATGIAMGYYGKSHCCVALHHFFWETNASTDI